MIMIGLSKDTFSAAEIPKDITRGDVHISGLATKALLKMNILEKVGYIPSPNADAKGRPVLSLRIPANKISTAKTLLSRQGFTLPNTSQLEMAI